MEPTEAQRLRALHALALLASPKDTEFDEIVELAAHVCGSQMAAMTVVGEERVFNKASIGVDVDDSPRCLSICNHTIRQDTALVIEDTARDDRFDGNPHVHSPGGIRFYAGEPISAPGGEKVGSLCVMDQQPRPLGERQLRSLKILARQIETKLQLRAKQAALLNSERLFRTFMDALPIEASLKDESGRLLFYNKRLADRFGITSQQWLGRTSRDIWPEAIAQGIMSQDEAVLSLNTVVESCFETPGLRNEPIYWRSTRFPCLDSAGRPQVAAISVDITDHVVRERELEAQHHVLSRHNEELLAISLTDVLTGLSNRRDFDRRLRDSVSLAQRNHQDLCLLVLDIDNFKQVNDRFGHQQGDEVLRHIGSILAQVKRIEDVASRLGGEEFAILLPCTATGGAMRMADRILAAVRSFPWNACPITVSIGCATLTGPMDGRDLYCAADHALYAAKGSGKNRCVLHAASTSFTAAVWSGAAVEVVP